MPKKNKTQPKTVKELSDIMSDRQETDVEEHLKLHKELKAKTNRKAKADVSNETKDKKKVEDVDKMRTDLINASRDGYTEKSVASIEKMTSTAVKKLYKEWTVERNRRANEFLTDLFISKFVDCVGGLASIEMLRKWKRN